MRRLLPESYYDQETLVFLRLVFLFQTGHENAFVASCRLVQEPVRRETLCCMFAQMVRSGAVEEAKMLNLLSHAGWPEAGLWLKKFLAKLPRN